MSKYEDDDPTGLIDLANAPTPESRRAPWPSPVELANRTREDAERRLREREAETLRRFEEEVASFRTAASGTVLYACPRCSGVVADPAKHLRWHEGLAETARKADSAYSMDTLY